MNAPLRPGTATAATRFHGESRTQVVIVAEALVVRKAVERILHQARLNVVAALSHLDELEPLIGAIAVDLVLIAVDGRTSDGAAETLLARLAARWKGLRIVLLVDTGHGQSFRVPAGIDALDQPASGHFDDFYARRLVAQLRSVASPQEEPASGRAFPDRGLPLRPMGRALGAVAIGGSTGGVGPISAIVSALPKQSRVPVFVTQHLPANFQPLFVQQLQRVSACRVMAAEDGMVARPGVVHLAPADAHIGLKRDGGGPARIQLNRQGPVNGCRPAVDPMMASAAALYGPSLCGVVLSGMGRDGLEGARAIVEAGGWIIAQDEASSAVWGMPGAVTKAGLASAVLAADAIVPLFVRMGLGT